MADTPETKVSKQWDQAIENGFIKTGYGLAVGLVAALVFMRSPALRSGVACFGAGTGFGISITESKALFEAVKPITVKAVKAEVPAPASE